jgi:hypothetical protein
LDNTEKTNLEYKWPFKSPSMVLGFGFFLLDVFLLEEEQNGLENEFI